MADDPIHKLMADVEEIAKVSPGEERSSVWVIPVVTALLLISGFLVYYFVYVTSQREHLANRNFRSLAVLGDQIQASVSAHGSILNPGIAVRAKFRWHSSSRWQPLVFSC